MSKTPLLSANGSRGFHANRAALDEYKPEKGVFPAPICRLFQVHGSKFKPDPSGDGGQASVICITHRVFLLRSRKDPFEGFFSLSINLLAQVGLSDALHSVQVFLPDVGCEYLLPFFICLAVGFGWAVDAVVGGAAVDSFPISVCYEACRSYSHS